MTTHPPTSITLQHCAKTWASGRPALQPLDLHIPAGEILALLGPSGCGKTTLLRLIAGLERADAGSRILFGDRDVGDLPAERRNVGVVFQNYALFPNLNVAENIAYGLRIRGVAQAQQRQRVEELLALIRLEDMARRRIQQLSGGQRQRVALARALAVTPSVLLLDEPLTALDAKLRDHLQTELADMLRTLGITTIIVTHDQQEAMILGQRIAVMSAGRIEQTGSAQDLYTRPESAFVGDFLGQTCQVRGILHGARLQAGHLPLRFRPHAARLEPLQHGDLAATITARYFLGDQIRYTLRLGDGQSLQITAPPDCAFQAGEQAGLRILQSAAH
ncbi:ABC transporter ATP-binding protein [Corticimicrobacter populi]|uniref:ABC transporter ATP-binding protein n=1 Tax=Corticimicrobacter populi TaxID=2175229 RepID=A0A2V1JUT4_9BURK|nr:ABC transporter ATP-binding protein [Corticimicrobacter populi]PWF21626.1 ABC transporter ATP-binding protein [Corticimicrobacter populi]